MAKIKAASCAWQHGGASKRNMKTALMRGIVA